MTVNGSTTSADSNGRYRIASLPANPYATYTVSVAAAGYSTVTLSATIAAGADTICLITLGTNYGSFTGTVTSGGSPVAGAIVQAALRGADQRDGGGGWGTGHILFGWLLGTYAMRIMASTLSANPGVVTGQAVTAATLLP